MKIKRILLSACVAMALPTAAQAGPLDGFMVAIFDTDTGFGLETSGIVFMNTLNDGYMDLSQSRTSAIDWHDGEHFNYKARTSARRSMVPPDEVTDRRLTAPDYEELTRAYLRLRRAFLKGAKEVAPVDTGYAQVAYDCWIEAAEGDRPDDVARCKSEFENRMARVEELADYGLQQIVAREIPEEVGPYMVYFQFDSTVMTQAGRDELQRAIEDALADPNTTVRLRGHADRSGPVDYNQRLSERRTQTVIENMGAAGIDTARITSAESVGETQPLVPTDDGVRNPFNRVVQIDLM